MNFITEKKQDKILLFFEKIKSETFNHILLYYFELIANNYFIEIINKYKKNKKENHNMNNKTKKECAELVLKRNLLFFNKALNHLDKIFENKQLDESNLNNLGKIYSIAYIKLYLKYLVEIFIQGNNDDNKIDFKPVIDIICNKENNVRKVIKIFFFKNCLEYFDNYSTFSSYMAKDEVFGKIYLDILESEINNKKENNYILNYNFISDKNFGEIYLKTLLKF